MRATLVSSTKSPKHPHSTVQCLAEHTQTNHLGAPSADEGHVVQQGGLDDLPQRLHHVLDVHKAQQQAQRVGPLQLPNAPVDVLRLQQVEPGTRYSSFVLVCKYWEEWRVRCFEMPFIFWYHQAAMIVPWRTQHACSSTCCVCCLVLACNLLDALGLQPVDTRRLKGSGMPSSAAPAAR